MVKGRLDPKALTATGYAWFVWEKKHSAYCRTIWIPQCRKQLERPFDYMEQDKRGKFCVSDHPRRYLYNVPFCLSENT